MRRTIFLPALLLLIGCSPALPTNEAARACRDLPRMERFECYQRLAVEHADVDYCRYVVDGGFRITCIKLVALKRCEVAICDAILEEWKRPDCREMVETAVAEGQC